MQPDRASALDVLALRHDRVAMAKSMTVSNWIGACGSVAEIFPLRYEVPNVWNGAVIAMIVAIVVEPVRASAELFIFHLLCMPLWVPDAAGPHDAASCCVQGSGKGLVRQPWRIAPQ